MAEMETGRLFAEAVEQLDGRLAGLRIMVPGAAGDIRDLGDVGDRVLHVVSESVELPHPGWVEVSIDNLVGSSLPFPATIRAEASVEGFEGPARLRFPDGSEVSYAIGRKQAGKRLPQRVQLLTGARAAQTVGAFEAPITELQRSADEGVFNPLDEEFIRNTLHQITLWRQRDDASPQIFELLVADLVKRLLAPFQETGVLEHELVGFGAEEDTARLVSEQVAAATDLMTVLGRDDAQRDAEILEDIDARLVRIEAGVRDLTPRIKSRRRRAAEVAGAATAAGAMRKVGEEGLVAVVRALDDPLSRIRIGLIMAWRTVTDWFVG